MKFDAEFEDQVLAKSLKDVVYLKKSVKILEAHHFSTPQHSWVWSCIKDIWDKYKEVCSVSLLVAKAKRDHKEEEREPYLILAKRLFKLKPDGAVAALEELAQFVRETNVQIAMEKAAKSLEKGRIDDVYETLRNVAHKDLKRSTYTHVEWIEKFEERQAERKYRSEHPEEFVAIPTGFKKLDGIITGLQLGELGLVLGTTGRGKSVMLNNIAYNAVKHSYNTVFFSFEMPARQVAMRQDARWLQIAYKKFKDYDFTSDELIHIAERLERMKAKFAKRLHIISMPVRGADINSIRSALDDLQADYGFKPQCLIFDSADHLRPVGRTESHRLDQAEIYWGIKGLSEEIGVASWSSTQASKEFVKQIITAEGASESYDKARIADLMISLNEPYKKTRATKPVDDDDTEGWDESKESGGILPEVVARGKYLELYVAKYRDGKSGVTIPLDAMLEKMLIVELADSTEE